MATILEVGYVSKPHPDDGTIELVMSPTLIYRDGSTTMFVGHMSTEHLADQLASLQRQGVTDAYVKMHVEPVCTRCTRVHEPGDDCWDGSDL